MKQLRLSGLRKAVVLSTVITISIASTSTGIESLRNLSDHTAYQVLAKESPRAASSSFLSPYGRAFVGRTSMIPVRSTYESSVDRSLRVFNLTPQLVEVLVEPDVLAGKRDGYIRVRGLKEGKAALMVDGNRLQVDVVTLDDREIKGWRKPQLVGPAQGAFVWGDFSIGAEYFDPLGDERTRPPVLRLKRPDGRLVRPERRNDLSSNILQRAVFNLRARHYEEGPQPFVVVAEFADGTKVESDPYYLNITHPKHADIIRGECEDYVGGARPARAGERQPNIANDEDAKGGRYVVGGYPWWVMNRAFPEDGVYQLMMRVRGGYAGSAFPTIGVQLDEQGQPDTAARAVDTQWHRIPVGRPFRVEGGDRFISIRLMNSFNAGRDHRRHLHIDNYELLRVDDPTAAQRSEVAMMSDDPSAMRAAPATARAGSQENNMMTDEGNMMMGGGDMMMDMMGGSGHMGMNPLISMIAEDKRLRVAFLESFDREMATGEITLNTRAYWDKKRLSDAPEIGLILNKSMYRTEQGERVSFRIPRNQLQVGWNTVELIARNSHGEVATSVEQRIFNPNVLVPGAGPSERYEFPVSGDGWTRQTKPYLRDDRRAGGEKVALLASRSSILLDLPPDLMGNYRLVLDGFGDNYKGPAEAEVVIAQGEHERKLGVVQVRDNRSEVTVSDVRLPAGPKQLRVSFINDLYEGSSDADRNLYVASVIVEKGDSYRDTNAPVARIAYPADGHDTYGFDAVVARVVDDTAVKDVRLIVNGEQYGDRQRQPNGLGKFVFPLVLRDMKPGKVLLQIEAEDVHGHTVKTDTIIINVLEEQPQELTRFERAVRLLDRFAYGMDHTQLARVLADGEREWLMEQLTLAPERGDIQAMELAKAHFAMPNNVYHVQARAVDHLLRTDSPARARFVQWTQNHFSTWIRKTGAYDKWDEYETFFTLGTSPFQDLLLASATSPAMLRYLDQNRSFANRINENYAREVLELHTLGVDNGYTQEDVTYLANLLTGVTVSEEADQSGSGTFLPGRFRYEATLGSGSEFRLLWTKFRPADPTRRFDRVRQIFEMLASSPYTAEYVTHKVLQHYVENEPDQEMHDFLQRVFIATGGDMRAVLIAITEHPRFWQRDLPSRFVSHRDYGVRLFRTSNITNANLVHRMSQAAGMGMFDRDTPDGYPEDDAAYAGSNGLIQRWKLAKEVQGSLPVTVPASILRQDLADPDVAQSVIDFTVWQMLGKPLSVASNKAALDILTTSEGKPADRAKELASLIAMLPESNLR